MSKMGGFTIGRGRPVASVNGRVVQSGLFFLFVDYKHAGLYNSKEKESGTYTSPAGEKKGG